MRGRATRAIYSAFAFVRWAEFEILFLLLFFIAFLICKDLGTGTGMQPFQEVTSRIARFIDIVPLSGGQMSNVARTRKFGQARIYMFDQGTGSVAH